MLAVKRPNNATDGGVAKAPKKDLTISEIEESIRNGKVSCSTDLLNTYDEN